MSNNISDNHITVQDFYNAGKYNEAFTMAFKFANENDVHCMTAVGWSFYEGKGCDYNLDKAIEWFKKAADENDSEAYFGLGCIHYKQEQYTEAFNVLKIASELGYVPALRWLGILYEYGLGTNKNLEKAFLLYIEAADKGNLRAERAYISFLFKGHEGILGQIKALPLLIVVIFKSFSVAMKIGDNSIRLQ